MEENAESLHIPPWKVIAFLSSDVYVCNILSFCCCVCTQLRGDLYARGAIENCLLRDAALMSSLHVSQKPLRRRRGGQTGDRRFVLCHWHNCDQARSAVQSPSVSLFREAHTALCAARELG